MEKKRTNILKIVLSALFFALAYVLPFLTGQIPQIGGMLTPMHIPVLLCGFVCGWPWGLVVGFAVPLFRALTIGVPYIFPKAVYMAFELAAYGAVAGVMHRILPKRKPFIYCSLLTAMLVGRAVYGVAKYICLGIKGDQFTFSMFIAGAFTESIPGIIVQIVLVPILVMVLENPKILKIKDR